MKVAVIGSRSLKVAELERFLPEGVDCIVSGGALGVDSSAADFAKRQGIPLKVFRPDYDSWGRRAPLIRNTQIVDFADMVLAFWDGVSKGTEFVVSYCQRQGKPLKIYLADPLAKGGFRPYEQEEQLKFDMDI